MTIALALFCSDGIVLAADRQMSLATYEYDEKKTYILKRENLQIGLVGSGAADLIKFAAQSLDRRIHDREPIDDVRKDVEAIAVELDSHVKANPDVGQLSLLVGVKTDADLGLLKLSSTVVIWVEPYDAIGIGKDMARLVLRRFYSHRAVVSCERGMRLAVQAVKLAKENVPGCGGPTDVIVLRRKFHAYEVAEERVIEHESNVNRFDNIVNPVLLALTDPGVSPEQLNETLGKMSVELNAFRSNDFIAREKEQSEKEALQHLLGEAAVSRRAPSGDGL